ncbi:CXXC-type zinc finger protein 1-like isoform X1 [Drosophila simulans]|uniref:CXXC-type zinc finger protein 1-like isoform X1 n=1 Tax=Drosophila simulans TaxID=7240 RepID=UPI00192CFAF3|nr:CXXC-type zinc finger protein 1-like isoform X1 [Drosophila simulans]
MTDKKTVSKQDEEIRREIAREFDLPERKSKIATILKQEGQAYCICRSSDCSRFMIGCDGCEEWYHGDCIGITEKDAEHIKKYYCRRCKKENPELQTIFRLVDTERAAASNAASTSLNAPGVSPSGAAPAAAPVAPATTSQQAPPPTTVAAMRKNNSAREPKESGPTEVRPRRKRKKATPKTRNIQVGPREASPEIFLNPELQGIRQCHGPNCCSEARPQSEYCSDECNANFAVEGLFQALPQQMQDWNITPSQAAEATRKLLADAEEPDMDERVRKQQEQLAEVEKQRQLIQTQVKQYQEKQKLWLQQQPQHLQQQHQQQQQKEQELQQQREQQQQEFLQQLHLEPHHVQQVQEQMQLLQQKFWLQQQLQE